MKIRLGFLALGLVALLGSLLASSSRISAYAATDRLSSSPAAGPSMLGTGKTPLGGAIPAPGVMVTSTTYLPVLMKPGQGIFGYLTQGGAPAPIISLQLRVYDAVSDTPAATATTNSAGYYLFTGIPALAAGQSYYVLYVNGEEETSRLGFWASRDVTSYTPSSSVDLGTSDLANIDLVAPSPGAIVALPHVFQWAPRPATPSDHYLFTLYNPNTHVNAVYPPVGYVGSYNLTALPSGFSPNVQYYWYIALADSNAGVGVSYWMNPITFSNSGTSVSGPLNMVPQWTGRRNDLLPHPHSKE